MDPLTILTMIEAGISIAGPVLTDAVKLAESIGADVSAHKSALQTFQDAFGELVSLFRNAPIPSKA